MKRSVLFLLSGLVLLLSTTFFFSSSSIIGILGGETIIQTSLSDENNGFSNSLLSKHNLNLKQQQENSLFDKNQPWYSEKTSPFFTEKQLDEWKEFCRNYHNCFDARCYSPVDYSVVRGGGGCLPNRDHFRFPSNSSSKIRRDSPENIEMEKLFHRKNSKHLTEFGCSNRRNQRDVLQNKIQEMDEKLEQERQGKSKRKKLFLNDNELDQQHDEHLWKFKKHSSWLFNKWYDWNGTCLRSDPYKEKTQEDFRLRGYHDPTDGLYRIENFCLRPSGRIAGWNPKRRGMETFRGAEDVLMATHQVENEPQMWLEDAEVLQEIPTCFLDMNLILYYINSRNDNSGHSLYRAGSMLRVIEHLYGFDAMMQKPNGPKVTIGYVAIESGQGATETRENIVTKNTMRYFHDILGTSWFSVYYRNYSLTASARAAPRDANGMKIPEQQVRNSYHERKQQEEEIYGFVPSDNDLRETLVCFKKATVFSQAYVHEGVVQYGIHKSYLTTTADDRVDHRGIFHIHGHRSSRDVETLSILDSRLRSCGNLPPRRKEARKRNPKIMLAARSKWRRLSLFPYLIDYIDKTFKKTFGSETTLDVFEHSYLTMPELIQRYSDVDIVLANYGNALTPTLFCPPNAMIVEFNTESYRYAHSGINLSPASEFGGGARIAHLFHIVVGDNRMLHRFPIRHQDRPFVDFAVSFRYFDFIREKVIRCIHKEQESTRTSSGGGESNDNHNISAILAKNPNILDFPRLADKSPCQFDQKQIDQLGEETVKFDLVDMTRRLASLRLFPSSNYYYSPRIDLITQNAELVTESLRYFMEPHSDERHYTILIVEPCAARAQVFPEFSLFRQLMEKVPTLYVAEFATGEENCLKKNNNQNSSQQQNDRPAWGEAGINDFVNYGPPDRQVVFCKYPCLDVMRSRQQSFDIVLHDCHLEKKCRVDFGHDDEDHDHREAEDEKYLSASEIFQKVVRPLYGTLLSFDVQEIEEKQQHQTTKTHQQQQQQQQQQSTGKIFVTSGPIRHYRSNSRVDDSGGRFEKFFVSSKKSSLKKFTKNQKVLRNLGIDQVEINQAMFVMGEQMMRMRGKGEGNNIVEKEFKLNFDLGVSP